MSIEATSWALRQRIPLNARCVLVALADLTDTRTGRVCYGRTDMAFLAEKYCMSVRSLWRMIGALVRNGYVRKRSGKEDGNASLFWLCLDRIPAASIKEWKWTGAVNGAVVSEEGCANDFGEDDDAPEAVDNVEEVGTPGVPTVGTARLYSSTKVHQRARATVPVEFSRETQDIERGVRGLKAVAESQGAKIFVIADSRAWNEWCDYRRRHGLPGTLPTTAGVGKFAGKRGWYMPTLFPKTDESTGPPGSLSDDDARAFVESG